MRAEVASYVLCAFILFPWVDDHRMTWLSDGPPLIFTDEIGGIARRAQLLVELDSRHGRIA